MHWLLAATALAAPPNRLARLWPIDKDGGSIERMAISPSGDIVVGRTRETLTGWLLDVDGWEMYTFAPCEVTGVAPIEFEDGTSEIWTSCADGTVRVKTWDGTTVGTLKDAEGADVVFELDDSLAGIFYDDFSGLMYALSNQEKELSRLHVIDPYDLDLAGVDAAVFPSYPKDLAWNGFNEAVVVDGYLIVSHGGRDMSSLQLGVDGATSVPPVNNLVVFDCDDIAPSPFGGVYCVDDAGQVADFRPITNIFNVVPLGELIEPAAVCASEDLTDGWLAVTGSQVKVWEMAKDGSIESQTPYFETLPDANNPIQDMVTRDGYLYGGGVAGNLHIVTARPWVYPIKAEPEAATSGEAVLVSFQVDENVDWELFRGGDRTGEGGVALASGTASGAKDETIEVEVTVDDGWVEGDNPLYVVAENATGLLGHNRASVSVDNPPKPPALTDANVKFGDEKLTLSFDGIADADLDHYMVYVTQTEYAAGDWPTGGPDFDGTTGLKAPITVTAAGGERVTLTLSPLENDVTYYIGVRAWDQGGKEGPMSKVVKGMPQQTYTAAELAGEAGGTPCSTGPAAGWIALASAGLLALRRRKGLAAGLLALGLLLPGAARADDDETHWWKQDLTPSRGNFELRYGVIGLDDPNIRQVYRDNPTNILMGEVGPQIFRFAEVDLGFGFFQELAYTVTDGGAQSGERTMLTWWPFALDGTLRAHFVDEQPVVPFVRYGFDYVIWSEKWDDGAGGKDVVRGGKFGSHYGLGVNLLLDIFQPGRASLLEAHSGINDSWLTIEWRRQRVDGRQMPWSGAATSGFDFGGDQFTLGLKLDY